MLPFFLHLVTTFYSKKELFFLLKLFLTKFLLYYLWAILSLFSVLTNGQKKMNSDRIKLSSQLNYIYLSVIWSTKYEQKKQNGFLRRPSQFSRREKNEEKKGNNFIIIIHHTIQTDLTVTFSIFCKGVI